MYGCEREKGESEKWWRARKERAHLFLSFSQFFTRNERKYSLPLSPLLANPHSQSSSLRSSPNSPQVRPRRLSSQLQSVYNNAQRTSSRTDSSRRSENGKNEFSSRNPPHLPARFRSSYRTRTTSTPSTNGEPVIVSLSMAPSTHPPSVRCSK